jgi:hypothetical protein
MNQREILLSVFDDIEQQLQHHQPQPPASIPTTISPALAAALLQKSLRRAQVGLALAATDILLRASPSRLWRRLSVISIEDIGIASIDTLYVTIAAVAHRQRLAQRFGARRLANFIATRLAAAAKDRGADDLHVATEHCSAWRESRLELADMTIRDLLDVIASDDPIERRAIAVRYAIGTMGASSASVLAKRRGQPQAVFDLLCEITPHTLAEVAREAFRQTREPFTAFLPLLYRELDGGETELVDDDFPPETMVGGIPSWAIDGFSQEGRRALSHFLNSDAPTARWLRANVSAADRMKVLRRAQFQAEAGLVVDRLRWPTGDRLRRQADLEAWQFPPQDAATLLALLQSDIPALNRSREATYGR